MSNFWFITKALADAVEDVVADLVIPEIIDNTPRNIDKYPIQNINRKDGKPPKREKVWPYKWVVIGKDGNYYSAVTGNIKKSIAHERKGNVVSVGVLDNGTASKYAHFLEFGTRHIAPRFFVRDSVYWPGQHARILAEIQKRFNRNLSK